MSLQGLCYFPGVRQVLSAGMTLSHGISPSVATIVIAPQDDFVPQVGTLSFAYGGSRVDFFDCKLDKFSFDRSHDGSTRWTLYVLDRRWKWQSRAGGGQISGYYNTRRNDNEIVESTQKDAQALAKLLLEALDEDEFDVSVLPNDAFPQIDWDYARPAEELARLCESLGCRIVLGLDDSVRIVKLGDGARLPLDDDVLDDSLTIDIPEMPDELVCVGAKNRYQADLELEAVALDKDGDIKRLQDVSYNPQRGEGVQLMASDLPNFLNISDLKMRELAKTSAFRWYRIKDNFRLPGVPGSDLKLARILPLEGEQIEKFEFADAQHNLPAWVYGIYHVHDHGRTGNSTNTIEPRKIAAGNPALFGGSFQLDRDLGIVKFAEPMFRDWDTKVISRGTKVERRPAKLFLRTSVGLRDKQTGGWLRRVKRRKLGNTLNSLPRYIVKNDACLNSFYNSQGNAKDNADEVDEMLEFYLDAAEREYQVREPRAITYAGLKPIDLDGAIRQWTISIGPDGQTRTRISRNREELDVEISYAERRLSERTIARLHEEERRRAASSAERAKGNSARSAGRETL